MHRLAAAFIAMAMVAACSTVVSPTPTPFRVSLSLITELAGCASLGGCAGYAGITPAGAYELHETRLSNLGRRQPTAGLPPSLAPGSYTARFRLVAVSDDRAVGQAPTETTIGYCSVEISVVRGGDLASGVEITVVFRDQGCEASVVYTAVDA